MRFRTLLMSLFAFLGAVLAALGIYGVVSYSVTQRSREIGLRMALGASRAGVLSSILRESLTLAIVGVGLGLVTALTVSRFLSRLVFGISTTDPMTLLGVPVLVILIALLASYLAARRAASVDPMTALRYE